MNEKANCYKCGNVNEVKVSTGHSKPENKGKKYFTCANCGQFQWVDSDGKSEHSSGLKMDYSKMSERTAPVMQPIPKEPVVENEWAPVARENMAKKALDVAANFYAKVGVDDEAKIFTFANTCYAWIRAKRENEEITEDTISEILNN